MPRKAKDHGWLNDPSVKANRGGPPPEGHVRRCQGALKAPHRQCPYWALKGRRYCGPHGGRIPLHKTKQTLGYLSKNAGATLSEKLMELSQLDPEERNCLAEEVDMQRILTQRSVKIFELCCLEPDPEGKVTSAMKAKATEGLRKSLLDVSEIVAKSAMIRAKNADVVGVEDLGFVVHQVKTIIEKICPEYAVEIGKALETIQLPKHGGAMDAEQVVNMLQGLESSIPGPS